MLSYVRKYICLQVISVLSKSSLRIYNYILFQYLQNKFTNCNLIHRVSTLIHRTPIHCTHILSFFHLFYIPPKSNSQKKMLLKTHSFISIFLRLSFYSHLVCIRNFPCIQVLPLATKDKWKTTNSTEVLAGRGNAFQVYNFHELLFRSFTAQIFPIRRVNGSLEWSPCSSHSAMEPDNTMQSSQNETSFF